MSNDTFTSEQITRQTETWDHIANILTTATAIASDDCHRIYILLDDEQTAMMHGYAHLITTAEQNPTEMLHTIQGWFDASYCGLRFITSVATTPDPIDGFTHLIPQFDDAFTLPDEEE